MCNKKGEGEKNRANKVNPIRVAQAKHTERVIKIQMYYNLDMHNA